MNTVKKPKEKRLNNVHFIKRMMEFSRYGALSQVFILEAIRKEAERVAATKVEQYDKNAWFMISVEGWIGVAKEIAEQFKKRD